LRQPIGVVIRVAARAVVQEIAVVVPGVSLAVDGGEAIGRVVLIVYHTHRRCQSQAVAHGVVGVAVVLTGGVGGRDEAVERVVDVGDDTVGGGPGRTQRYRRRCRPKRSYDQKLGTKQGEAAEATTSPLFKQLHQGWLASRVSAASKRRCKSSNVSHSFSKTLACRTETIEPYWPIAVQAWWGLMCSCIPSNVLIFPLRQAK
jgi:hypothetical protein